MSLVESGLRAVKWNTVTTVLRFLLQLAAQVVLARYLGPDNYGVFGIGLLVLTFSTFLANFGLGQSLLHRKELGEEDIRFAFTWQVMAGFGAAAAVWLAAPYVAEFFREPRAEAAIRWLSLTCIFSAASSPAGNLAQRDLKFKELGLAQLASYFVGYILVGVPMAMMGFGYEALVAAWLIQSGGVAAASFALHPHSVKPLFSYQQSGVAANLSGIVFATNLVNWILTNLDRIAVGRLLDTRALGVYSVSYNLATMPNSLLLSSLQPTLMAVGARMQGENERLKRGYLQILAFVWVVLLPAFSLLSAASEQIISVLYGAKWQEAAPVLRMTFLAMPALLTTGLSTPILWGSGKRHLEATLQAPVILVALAAYGGMYLTVGGDLFLAAALAVSIMVLRMSIVFAATARAVGLPVRSVAPLICRGLALGGMTYGLYLGVEAALVGQAALVIALAGGAAVVCAGTALACIDPRLLGEPTIELLCRLAPTLTKFLKRKQ